MSWVTVGVSLATMLAGAYQQDQVAGRRDDEAAASIRRQSMLQRKADAKVNERVQTLEGSTAEDERAKSLGDYMQQLRAGRAKSESGLTPMIGSAEFQQGAQDAAGDVQGYASDTAGLMARIDAAGIQRQGEAFGYGNLATDIGLIGRESAGEDFMSRLRMGAIRRNPWIDAAVAAGGAYATSKAGQGGKSVAPPSDEFAAGFGNNTDWLFDGSHGGRKRSPGDF